MTFDDELRRRLQGAVRIPENDQGALSQVRPRLVRARRMRRAAVASTTVAALACASIVGAAVARNIGGHRQLRNVVPLGDDGVLAPNLPSSIVIVPGRTDPATTDAPSTTQIPPPTVQGVVPRPPDAVSPTDETTSIDDASGPSTPSAGDEPTAPVGGTEDGAPPASAATPPSTATGHPNSPPSTQAPHPSTSDDSHETDAPPSSKPTTTAQPPASTTAGTLPSSPRTIASDCGTVTVNITSTKVTLVSTSPMAGFRTDVSDDGGGVGVEFTDPTHHCEIKAGIVLGVYHQSVDNHRGDS